MMRRDVFQAIADPTRREILQVIANKQLNLNAVAAHFEISRPAISKHIKILDECGLIEIKQEGRERFCRADPAGLEEVSNWVNQYRSFWSSRLNALQTHLDKNNASEKKIKPKKRNA